MNATRIPPVPSAAVTLGAFLRERRARLQPEAGAVGRRRTPGLRREEVAARAHVSVTWYTWLEQGRGGAPSDEVLDRLVGALELDAAHREILFLLAQQRPPPVVVTPTAQVPHAVQRVLDALPMSPAIVKTPIWDVVTWNAAALAVLGDYPAMPVRDRNLLRRLFSGSGMRGRLIDWEAIARFAVGVFRIDVARMGGSAEADALVEELQESSADFRQLWADYDVRNHGAGRKRIRHASLGMISMDYSSFYVDGADGLSMVVYTPATPDDARAIEGLLSGAARSR